MSDSGSAPYHVTLIGDVPASIWSLAKKAAPLGKKRAFLDAFRIIQERLSRDPGQFGEQRYTLSKNEMPCHIGAIQPVAVQFAIHEEKRAVFIFKVFLMGS